MKTVLTGVSIVPLTLVADKQVRAALFVRVIPLVPPSYVLFVIRADETKSIGTERRIVSNSGVYLRPLAGVSSFETTAES